MSLPNEVEFGRSSLWRDAWHRLAKNRLAVVGTVMLGVLLLASFFGPLLVG